MIPIQSLCQDWKDAWQGVAFMSQRVSRLRSDPEKKLASTIACAQEGLAS